MGSEGDVVRVGVGCRDGESVRLAEGVTVRVMLASEGVTSLDALPDAVSSAECDPDAVADPDGVIDKVSVVLMVASVDQLDDSVTDADGVIQADSVSVGRRLVLMVEVQVLV